MDVLIFVIKWLVEKGDTMPILADITRPEVLGVMIPIIAIMGGIIIAIVSIIIGGRRKELEHKERLLAMEKGIEIPQPAKPERRPAYQSNRSRGFVVTLVGLSLTIALWATDGADDGVWGLIPLAVGIGLLISSAVEKNEIEKKETRSRAGQI